MCDQHAKPVLEPYSDFTVQWGASGRVEGTAAPKQFWSRGRKDGKPTRQTSRKATTARHYQDKSPRPTESGDLRGVEGEAKLPPPVAVLRAPQPRHVAQCWRQGGRGWAIWVQEKAHPELKVRLAYTCKSWRCLDEHGRPSECARAAAAQLFARIKEACEPYAAQDFSFWVLTLDRNGYYSGKPWANAEVAYKSLGKMSERLIKRIRRFCEKQGWEPLGSEWIQVVEAHKSGWPHVNLLIKHAQLARYLNEVYIQAKADGHSEQSARLLSGRLSRHAQQCGWGLRSTAEPVRDKSAMSGYLTKLAAYADEHIGELAKLTQAPTNAPIRFRRLRSGKGFLPKVRKNGKWTGALFRRYYSPNWGFTAQPFTGKKQQSPERVQFLSECQSIEEREFIRELIAEQEARTKPPTRWGALYYVLPPVTHWINGVQVPIPSDHGKEVMFVGGLGLDLSVPSKPIQLIA